MDRWKFYWATRRYHIIDNPLSELKLRQVVDVLHLPPRARVLDIACGKAELLCLIAEGYSARCTGLDISPYMCDEATKRVASRGLASRVDIHNLRGEDYKAPPDSFDATLCIGATWVWGGLRGTLTALAHWTKPGGLVAAGEPYWTKDPPAEYLVEEMMARDAFATHAANVATGEGLGLVPLLAVASNADDWDRYEGLTWLAAVEYARENPRDSDVPDLLSRVEKAKLAYLRWGRDCLGWAVYLFQKPL